MFKFFSLNLHLKLNYVFAWQYFIGSDLNVYLFSESFSKLKKYYKPNSNLILLINANFYKDIRPLLISPNIFDNTLTIHNIEDKFISDFLIWQNILSDLKKLIWF